VEEQIMPKCNKNTKSLLVKELGLPYEQGFQAVMVKMPHPTDEGAL
jgi:hypothetical protein